VNTLDNRFVANGRLELLPRYAELLEFSVESGLIEPPVRESLLPRQGSRAARQALRSAWELRESLADLFYWNAASVDQRIETALATLGRYCAQASERQQVVVSAPPHQHGDSIEPPRFTLAWSAAAQRCELPVWILAARARELLVSPEMAHVRRCLSSTCQWLFLDTSKNHSRRWCDMKVCGNRMKARRDHSRRTGSVGSPDQAEK
jgi:predicted RNA-binding Zn ribbon-like protein